MQAQRAVTWARDHVFERSAVQDRRAILGSSAGTRHGRHHVCQIRQEFERRIEAGEFREVPHSGAGRQFTTTAMVRMEREIISRMQEGNRRDYGDPMLVSPQVRISTEDRHPELSASQRQAVDDILVSREKSWVWMALRAPARRQLCPLSAKARKPRDTEWRVSRQRPARRRNLPKREWRHPRYRSIWRGGSNPTPARSAFMCSTNLRWHRPGRCMNS